MTQYGFYFDSSRCTGCKSCELACKDYNDLGPDLLMRKIIDFEGGTWTQDEATGTWSTDTFGYSVSVSCNHCDNPACVANCPTGAMVKDTETGLVSSNPDVCIGCGMCVESCPYEMPKLDTEQAHCVKCDGCKNRVLAGEKPMCVDACPLHALDFGPIEDLRAQYGELADIDPLPDSSLTSPNLVVKVISAAEGAASKGGFVANPLEIA